MSTKFSALRAVRFSTACMTVSLIVSCLVLTGCLDEPTSFEDRNLVPHNDDDGHHAGDVPTNTNTDTPNPTENAGTDYVSGYWNNAQSIESDTIATVSAPSASSYQLDMTNDKSLFLSWKTTSVVNGQPQTDLSLRRATLASNVYSSWKGKDDSNFKPMTFSSATSIASFTANRASNDGYMLWQAGGKLEISEFMGDMGHFMGLATVDDGHAPQISAIANGAAYLVTQSHVAGGFALNVNKRTNHEAWAQSIVLNRTDAVNNIQMPNHFLNTTVNGQNNIIAIWLESQNGISRLMSAVFNTTSNLWGTVSTIVDSNNTNNFDVAAITSMSMSGEVGNANLHLVLYQDSAVEKAIFSIDYLATNNSWSMPHKRNMPMATKQIIGQPVYASNNNGSLMVAWVENELTIDSVMSLRLSNGTWDAVTTVQSAVANVQVEKMALAINDSGHALATWSEKAGNEMRVLSSLQMPGQPWPKKELIANYNNISMLKNITGLMLDDGTPWIVLGTSHVQGANSVLETSLVTRTANIHQVTPNTSVSTGTDAGHDHDDTGGTTSGGTTTGGDTTTGGGTTTGGNTTGGDTTGDNTTGGNTDTVMPPAQNAVSGLWATPENVMTSTVASSEQTMIASPVIQMTNNNVLFNHWVTQFGFDATSMTYSNQNITMTIRSTDSSTNSGNITSWTTLDSTMTIPQSFNSTSANDPHFIVNQQTGNGIATWESNGNILTSEYMGQMKHFMSSAELTNQSKPILLSNAAGDVTYLLTKTAMMGGFGLAVNSRTAADQWAVESELHRMATDPYSNPNDFIVATIDGQNNLRAIWLEQQGVTLSLHTATYDSTAKTWGAVSEIIVADVLLNKLVSGIVSKSGNGSNLNVLLYQKNAEEHGLFFVSFDGSNWGAPMRLDAQTATSKISSMPTYTSNTAGNIAVAWVERDTAMTATNASNSMNMIMARQFNPATGWSSIEHVVHVPMDADAMEVKVALNVNGEASLAWVESTSHGSDIVASHSIASNSSAGNNAWSQKESIAHVMNSNGAIQSLTIAIESNNIPMMLWVVKSTNGINDTFSISRVSRLTMIHNATVPSDTGNNTTTDPVTDPGNNTDPGNGTSTPVNLSWSTPVMALQRTQNATTTSVLTGPHVLLDDLGGSVVHLSSQNTTNNNGTSIETADNYISSSNDQVNWTNLLNASTLFDDLSANAMMDRVRIIPGTGGIYGLIKDNNKLYLARYMVNAGWSKSEIPGVQLNAEQFKNFQMISNDTGMVTITWNDAANIYAKHYMVSTTNDWLPTQVKPVAAIAILAPHFIDDNGNVHATWLESSGSINGGFALKMSTYIPMQGWTTEDTAGPQGINNSRVKLIDNGTDKMVITVNLVANIIDAFIQNNDGTWMPKLNVNAKQVSDNVELIKLDKMQVHTGGADRFVIVWQELLPNASGTDFIEQYKSISVHRMVDANTGMKMSHWSEPSQISDALMGLENNLKIAMDSTGVTYAVWTNIDVVSGKSRVYVNQAAAGGSWSADPKMLVEYDIASGNFADQPGISINSMNEVAIAWTQRMSMGSTSMHHVWVVNSQ